MVRTNFVYYDDTNGKLVLHNLPEWLIPAAPKLRKELLAKYEGAVADSDLLYQINWEIHQWIIKMYDDFGMEETE